MGPSKMIPTSSGHVPISPDLQSKECLHHVEVPWYHLIVISQVAVGFPPTTVAGRARLQRAPRLRTSCPCRDDLYSWVGQLVVTRFFLFFFEWVSVYNIYNIHIYIYICSIYIIFAVSIYIYMGSGRFPGPMELLLQQLVRVSKTRWR